MYCKTCGKPLPDGAKFCGVCGTGAAATTQNVPAVIAPQPVRQPPVRSQPYQNPARTMPYVPNPYPQQNVRTCNLCHVPLQSQLVTETPRRGVLEVIFLIVLLCVPVIGWIALIILLRGRKSVTRTVMYCPSCGARYASMFN